MLMVRSPGVGATAMRRGRIQTRNDRSGGRNIPRTSRREISAYLFEACRSRVARIVQFVRQGRLEQGGAPGASNNRLGQMCQPPVIRTRPRNRARTLCDCGYYGGRRGFCEARGRANETERGAFEEQLRGRAGRPAVWIRHGGDLGHTEFAHDAIQSQSAPTGVDGFDRALGHGDWSDGGGRAGATVRPARHVARAGDVLPALCARMRFRDEFADGTSVPLPRGIGCGRFIGAQPGVHRGNRAGGVARTAGWLVSNQRGGGYSRRVSLELFYRNAGTRARGLEMDVWRGGGARTAVLRVALHDSE